MEIDIGLSGIITKLLTFVVALTLVYFMEWMYDRTSKVDTDKSFDTIETDARALAVYFGLRTLAFCVLAGYVFS